VDTFFIGFEVICWIAGVILLFRGAARGPASLLRWEVSPEKFITCVLLVAFGGLIVPQILPYISNDTLGPAAYDGDWWMILQGTAFQGGMLGGAGLAAILLRVGRTPTGEPPLLPPAVSQPRSVLVSGVVTFLIALPLVGAVGFVWKWILTTFGIDPGEQEMIGLFRNASDPILLVWMWVLAAVIAPVTEELIFRAGLFRYLHKRVQRPFALGVPALLFAALHGNIAAFVPLFALGVFFAFAYERTGRIGVPMIAHALFNLNTILMILAGVVS
jgi:uncharacterized protein